MNVIVPVKITDQARRANAMRAAGMAIFDCHPEDRLPLIEFLQDYFSAGAPLVTFGPIMAEATDWANWASRKELKAYCLAAFNRMPLKDQDSFLAYVSGGHHA